MSIVVGFTVLTHIRDYLILSQLHPPRHFHFDKEWIIACAVVTTAWLVIKILKKTTRLLSNHVASGNPALDEKPAQA
jgi:hypothetical protein